MGPGGGRVFERPQKGKAKNVSITNIHDTVQKGLGTQKFGERETTKRQRDWLSILIEKKCL